MQRISVHISDETKQRLNIAVKAMNAVEAQVIRQALDIGLQVIYPKSKSAQGLLKLAKLAEKLPHKSDAPNDVSENLDYYAWGGAKKGE